jgi:hypothetical protein
VRPGRVRVGTDGKVLKAYDCRMENACLELIIEGRIDKVSADLLMVGAGLRGLGCAVP